MRNSPESNDKVTPKTLSEIMRAANSIITLVGVEKKGLFYERTPMVTATVPIESPTLTKAAESSEPKVIINRPIRSFAAEARWFYEITYGMKDSSASRHIIVLNGERPEAEMSFYDGMPDRSLTEAEGQAIATDLNHIVMAGI